MLLVQSLGLLASGCSPEGLAHIPCGMDGLQQQHSRAFHIKKTSRPLLGSVLGRFGLQIRILREKLYRVIVSDKFFMSFLKIWTPGWPANGGNFEVGSWKSVEN